MKSILFFILTINVQLSFGQIINDSIQKIVITKEVGLRRDNEKYIGVCADSINNRLITKMPNFLLNECLDWDTFYWPSFHESISVRWEILKKVTNKKALKVILQTHDIRLKRKCDYKGEKTYPYITVPMLNKSFYQLIEKRLKQLG